MTTPTAKKLLQRKPKGFREGFDFQLACPHRNMSVCDECVAKYENIVDNCGTHLWFSPAELEVWREFERTGDASALGL